MGDIEQWRDDKGNIHQVEELVDELARVYTNWLDQVAAVIDRNHVPIGIDALLTDHDFESPDEIRSYSMLYQAHNGHRWSKPLTPASKLNPLVQHDERDRKAVEEDANGCWESK